ncbi:MAG: hypothetical protein LBK60_00145, partial [Verrucomicrobiales bacterium]|nr:hypothetical protein [Verrucomicrobiales bacterium]
ACKPTGSLVNGHTHGNRARLYTNGNRQGVAAPADGVVQRCIAKFKPRAIRRWLRSAGLLPAWCHPRGGKLWPIGGA